MSELLDVANELYGLGPGDFTNARNERAKQIRADGNRDLANEVKALGKPSVAAWVVNMMVRHLADQIDQVLDLGANLRQAAENLDGAELRQLNKQRRQLTTAVTSSGRALAADLGQKVSDAVATQVEATLHAAMTDEDAEAAVRTGLLVEPLEATGLGGVDLTGAVAVPSALGERAPRLEPPVSDTAAAGAGSGAGEDVEAPQLSVVPDDTRELEEAEEAATAAGEATAKAQKKLDKAEKRVGKSQGRVLQLQEELEEVRRRAAELEHQLDLVDEELTAAEEKRTAAKRRLAEAELDEQRAIAKLERLRKRRQ